MPLPDISTITHFSFYKSKCFTPQSIFFRSFLKNPRFILSMTKTLLPTQEVDINVELPVAKKTIELSVTKEEDTATSTENSAGPPSVIISNAVTSWFACSILWIAVSGLIHANKNSKIDCQPQGGNNVSGFYGPGVRTAWLFTVFASIAQQGFSKQPRQDKGRRRLSNMELNIILALAYPCIAAVDILYHHPILWNSYISAPKPPTYDPPFAGILVSKVSGPEPSTYGPLIAGMLTVLSGASFGVGILAIIYFQNWSQGSSSRLTIVLIAATTAFLVLVSKLCFFTIYGVSAPTPILSFIKPTFASIFPETPSLFLNSKTCFGHVNVFLDWLDVSDHYYGFLSHWIWQRNILGGLLLSSILGQPKLRNDIPSLWKRVLQQVSVKSLITRWITCYLAVHFWKLFLVIGYGIYDPQVMAPVTSFPITNYHQLSALICSGAFVVYGIWNQLRNETVDEIGSKIAYFLIGPLFPLIIICIIGSVIYQLILKAFALLFRRRGIISEV